MSTDDHPHSPEYLSLFFFDSNHGWAINTAQLLETIDGGRIWKEKLQDDNQTFYNLEFVSVTTGFIVGTQRKTDGQEFLILRTKDGGASWEEIDLKSLLPNLNSRNQLQSISFCNSDAGWSVGADSIIHTTDGGKTWSVQRFGNDEMLWSIACTNSEQAWVVGNRGLILRTSDSGKHWNKEDTEVSKSLFRVRFSGKTGWIVGEHGTLLKLENGTGKWEQVPLSTSEDLLNIHWSGNEGWIIGTSGIILHSIDNGKIWQQEISPVKNDLISLFFLPSGEGWIGGNKRTLLHLN